VTGQTNGGYGAPTAVCGDTPTGVGEIVLVLQGGGALGAYQAGAYQAMHEAGFEPDWIIGTSIGAINGALIAGNRPGDRVGRLSEFWRRMAAGSGQEAATGWPSLARSAAFWRTVSGGIAGFFEPRPAAFWGAQVHLGAENAGYYSTEPLRRTLSDLVDVGLIASNAPRLTVGAAHVRSGRMHYFDSRKTRLDIRHIQASGALPPAFPAVRIDGELYWDGGILSNTPIEAVFAEDWRRNALIFAVHLWNPDGGEPVSMPDVSERLKDIQYASRAESHIVREQEMHKLRHVINQLVRQLPEGKRQAPENKALAGYGCYTRMHVVRLLAPGLGHDDQFKDVDFSADTIKTRWQAGYANAGNAIRRAAWTGTFDPLDGIVVHEGDRSRPDPVA